MTSLDIAKSAPGPRLPARAGFILAALLATMIAAASFRYLAGAEMAPPPLKPNFTAHPALFFVHIGLGTIALLVGPWQFLKGFRRRRLRLHRALGVAYVFACTVGGLAGLVIAQGSNGGPLAASGFSVLAILWIATTLLALVAVLQGRLSDHRRWMIRSFALTFAGVTLRLYLPLALIHIQDFSRVYAVIAWACWVPNLIFALWLTRKATEAA